MTAPPQGAQVDFDNNLARWSGTSFATPYVAARIAVHMERTRQWNARLAAKDLLTHHVDVISDETDGECLPVLRMR
jgi:hypothetical protein